MNAVPYDPEKEAVHERVHQDFVRAIQDVAIHTHLATMPEQIHDDLLKMKNTLRRSQELAACAAVAVEAMETRLMQITPLVRH